MQKVRIWLANPLPNHMQTKQLTSGIKFDRLRCTGTSNGTEKSNGPGKNTWLTKYFFRSSPVMELVPDTRYFINKNQKAFNFF